MSAVYRSNREDYTIMYQSPELTQGFIDESIISPRGVPLEYDGKPFDGSIAPSGLVVKEATQSEWDAAVAAEREAARAVQAGRSYANQD